MMTPDTQEVSGHEDRHTEGAPRARAAGRGLARHGQALQGPRPRPGGRARGRAGAAIPDQAFADAGATLVDGPDEVWASDIVLKVRPPTDEETGRLRQGQILIGMLEPYTSREQLDAYAGKGARAFAMELLPRTTRGQAMDVLSSQANLA